MPISITMPALSPTMEEGTLAKWLKAEGDEIVAGDVIAEIETDKATMEIEAVNDGVLAKIIVPEGTQGVAVNAVIAQVVEHDEVPSSVDETSETAVISSDVTTVKTEDEHLENGEKARPAGSGGAEEERATRADTQAISVREALRDAIAEEMRRDDRVFLLGEEVGEYEGAYKVSQGLLDEFGPKRVVDTPITEHGFAGVGVGAAYRGLRPIVEFMTFNFAMQAIDHIVNSAAKTLYMSGGKMEVPVVFRGPNGAASRVGAQHSQNYASWYAQVPGLKVVAPYSASDAKGLLKSAIRDPNPVVFLENEMLYGQRFEIPHGDDHIIPIGKARVIEQGSDVTIIAYSISVGDALAASRMLSEEHEIDAEVIDLRTIRPLDVETIMLSLSKTNRIVVAEEGWPTCGIAAEITGLVMEHGFDDLDAPVVRVTGEDVPMPYAANLEKLALPSPEKIVAAARAVCYR